MNAQVKTILLTVLTLSVFTIAIIELSGVSSTALFNKYGIGKGGNAENAVTIDEGSQRHKQALQMPKTEMTFVDTKHVFGEIKEGTIAKHAFHFKNTGTAPLLISQAVASCGCTVPSFPKQPIPPGGEGDITVEFNSDHRKGHQQKNVLIYSNAQLEKMSIGFEADVI
jgi:hypothetical protein